MSSTGRIEKEREFHDERFGGDDGARSGAQKYYAIALEVREYFKNHILECSQRGGNLLEYGCAMGSEQSGDWMDAGCRITGIDISPEAIQRANDAIKGSQYDGLAEYYVMNAEEMTFGDNRFDLIVGSGIIHHLDLNKSFSEIARVMTDNGCAVFNEPMGHNPIINLYRKLTPAMRTDDEHPLLVSDIELMKKYFNVVDVRYFNLFTLMAVPFRKTPFFKQVLSGLKALDNVLFKIPFFRKYAWNVVLHLEKPKQ